MLEKPNLEPFEIISIKIKETHNQVVPGSNLSEPLIF